MQQTMLDVNRERGDAKDSRIELRVEYLQQNDDLLQDYWRLHRFQRLPSKIV